MSRAEIAAARTAIAGRGSPARPAPALPRLAAYVVDWLVFVILCSAFVSIAGLQLYLAAGRGRHDAPDSALYAFFVISALAAPVWLVVTLVGWARAGRSVGKLALGLRIADRRGGRPGFARSLARLLVYVLENAPLVLAAAVVGLWIAAGDELPGLALPAAGLLLLVAGVALLPALLTPGGRPLHDLAAGTVVVEE